MTPQVAILAGSFILLAWALGCALGFYAGVTAGRKHVMTRSEAASILAKASWKNRDRVQVPLTRRW